VFEFADKHRGPYSSSLHAAVCPCYCDYSGYQDELLWGAAWLHKASRRREYREYIKRNEVVLGASDAINEFGWDNKHAGINVLISKVNLPLQASPLCVQCAMGPPTPWPWDWLFADVRGTGNTQILCYY